LADEDDGGADPRTWGPRGWLAMEEALRRYLEQPGPRLVLRPSYTDVISDAPSWLRFLSQRREWAGDGEERLGVMLDPVAMLAPSMVKNAEDHVARLLELVGSHAGVDAVAASNMEVRDGDVERAALHRGVMDAARIAGVYRSLAGVPIVIG